MGSKLYVGNLSYGTTSADLNAMFAAHGSVTSADVQRTWELITSPKLLGHWTELADQIEPIRGADSAFFWEAKLRQGLLDPLWALAFPYQRHECELSRPLSGRCRSDRRRRRSHNTRHATGCQRR